MLAESPESTDAALSAPGTATADRVAIHTISTPHLEANIVGPSYRYARIGILSMFASFVVLLAPAVLFRSVYVLWLALAPGGVALSVIVWIIVRNLVRLRGLHEGSVTVTSDTLVVAFASTGRTQGVELRYPRADLVSGWLADEAHVHLASRTGDTIKIQVADRTSGEDLLCLLGLGTDHRVLRASLSSVASRFPGGKTVLRLLSFSAIVSLAIVGPLLVVALFVLGWAKVVGAEVSQALPGILQGTIVTLSCALILKALRMCLRESEVTIGADGIKVAGPWRARFLPFFAIREVVRDRLGVVLKLNSGREELLRTAGWEVDAESNAGRDKIFERIISARAAARSRDKVHTSALALQHEGLSPTEWKAQILRATRSADYRSRPFSATELGSVLEDGSAPSLDRIAAYVALSAREPEDAKRRARIAAESCADDDIRAALESAAEGELAEEPIRRIMRRSE